MRETGGDSGKLRISLLENGAHSFFRSINAIGKYNTTPEPNPMLLKDAVMSLHHGVELLMKQILVQPSEFLIFRDLNKVRTKWKSAAKKETTVFDLDYPPKTISFEEAINRVDAFVQPPELTEDLVNKLLHQLNPLRNKLVHYTTTIKLEQVTKLLGEVGVPLRELFEAQVDGFKEFETEEDIQALDQLQHSAREYSRLEHEVFDLLHQFRGQAVPGRLFNVEKEEFTLPTFEDVIQNYPVQYRTAPKVTVVSSADIFTEGKDGERWVIEIKTNPMSQIRTLEMLVAFQEALAARAWLVVFSRVTLAFKQAAQEKGILVTGVEEWQELKDLLV